MRNDLRSRNHRCFWAFMVHRISGVALSIFLPLHFWALGQSLAEAGKFESFLRWTDHPLVKLSEIGLVRSVSIVPLRNSSLIKCMVRMGRTIARIRTIQDWHKDRSEASSPG